MDFAQLHEALRLEVLRRIERGVVTQTDLARLTGFKQAHISNFLRRRRLLSLRALDRVMRAQRLTVADLLAEGPPWASWRRSSADRTMDTVPLVSQAAAIHDPHIAAHDVIVELKLPPGTLDGLRERRSKARRDWQRFVAIRVTATQAEAMKPILSAHALVFLDRHYNSLAPYRPGAPTLFAIGLGNTVMIRYVTLDGGRLVLRPYSLRHPVELLDLQPGETAYDLLVGRAFLTLVDL